ncbi:hypothetical protein [Salegentibacter sp. HM20]
MQQTEILKQDLAQFYMKRLILLAVLFLAQSLSAQQNPAREFWDKLKENCGLAFEGEIIEGSENDAFAGKKLIMHLRSCERDKVRIPFIVGTDYSRTWVLSYEDDRIQLKHDHRHEDGSEDKITWYGGTASNTGLANLQIFPADDHTADLIPAAATNVWWIELDNESFIYNLKRIGSSNQFSVKFDLTNPIETPDAPWGWED